MFEIHGNRRCVDFVHYKSQFRSLWESFSSDDLNFETFDWDFDSLEIGEFEKREEFENWNVRKLEHSEAFSLLSWRKLWKSECLKVWKFGSLKFWKLENCRFLGSKDLKFEALGIWVSEGLNVQKLQNSKVRELCKPRRFENFKFQASDI